MAKKLEYTEASLDTVVVITVLTSSVTRRDQIDLALDKAFAGDARVQIVRVVGYPNAEDLAELARKFHDVVS